MGIGASRVHGHCECGLGSNTLCNNAKSQNWQNADIEAEDRPPLVQKEPN